MNRTISIGGATYDLFVRTQEDLVQGKELVLPLGSKLRVKEVIETCGGGASNTSVGLARLGCNASFCGVIGSDQWGEKLIGNMKKEGVNTDSATIIEGEVSSFSVILSAPSGERAILYTPGTNVHLHDATFHKESVARADWVYLNHIQEDSCAIQDDIIEILAKEGKPYFTWNPGSCQLDVGIEEENNRTLLSYTDLLVLNETEAQKFTKTNSLDEAMKTMLEIGAKNVCVTQGKEGSTASDGTGMFRCPVLENVTVIDTTGAGDAFGTGATWALLHCKDLQTALLAGTINAASVVSAIGAQKGLLTDTEMSKRLEETDLAVDVLPLS